MDNFSPQNVLSSLQQAQAMVDGGLFEKGAQLAQKIFEGGKGSNGEIDEALARRIFARAHLGLANEAHDLGNIDQRDTFLASARNAMAEAVACYRHPRNDGTFQLSDTLEEFALVLARSHQMEECRKCLDESIRILTAADEAEGKIWSDATIRLGNALISYLSFAKECDYQGDRLPVIEQLIEIGFRNSPVNQNIASLYAEKADALAQHGNFSDALHWYQESAAMFSELHMNEAAGEVLEQIKKLQT